jgi:nucleoside-diphosphate-sugar epimerase
MLDLPLPLAPLTLSPHSSRNTFKMAVEIALPSHVKTILLTGAGGFVGRELVQLLLNRFPDISLIATDVGTPPGHGVTDENRLLCVAANLCDKTEVEKLFEGKRIQAVFALQ